MEQRNILLCSRSLCVGSWMQRNILLCSRSLGGVNRGGVPQGRRGRRYSINPLVTSCHSPYMLRKQGETIMGSDIRYQPPRHVVPLPLYALQTGGDILPAGGVGSEIRYQPPRHVVPLPLYAPQTGGDNLASCVVVAPWGLGWRNPRFQPWGWWRPPYRPHRGRAVTRLETFTDGGDK